MKSPPFETHAAGRTKKPNESGAERNRALFTAFILGAAAVLLARLGNPPNMGICSACFERDVAGGLMLFSGPGPLRYLRPEVPGLLLGSFAAALLFRDLRSRGGSSPLLRFVIGAFVMIGALVFLGCPLRALERIAGGDYVTAGIGLLGLVAGAALGSFFIGRGFSLGADRTQHPLSALAAPFLALGLVAFTLHLSFGAGGDPNGLVETKWHAPLFASLAIAACAGFFSQRSRYCSVGGYRDALIWGDFRLLKAYGVFFAVLAGGNVLVDLLWPGGRKLLSLGAAPIAHFAHTWNFLSMVLVGLGSVLAGGCPFRQLIAAGDGNSNAAVTLLGLLFGAAVAHNFHLAATPASRGTTGGPTLSGMIAVITGIVVLGLIGLFCSEVKRTQNRQHGEKGGKRTSSFQN